MILALIRCWLIFYFLFRENALLPMAFECAENTTLTATLNAIFSLKSSQVPPHTFTTIWLIANPLLHFLRNNKWDIFLFVRITENAIRRHPLNRSYPTSKGVLGHDTRQLSQTTVEAGLVFADVGRERVFLSEKNVPNRGPLSLPWSTLIIHWEIEGGSQENNSKRKGPGSYLIWYMIYAMWQKSTQVVYQRKSSSRLLTNCNPPTYHGYFG